MEVLELGTTAETVWPRAEIAFVETKFGTRPCIGFGSTDSMKTLLKPSAEDLVKIQLAMKLRKTANWYEEARYVYSLCLA